MSLANISSVADGMSKKQIRDSQKVFEGGWNYWRGECIESMAGNTYLHPEKVLPLIRR